jgi:HPt (histidine-containing phosphotransfer) domain-containing protein
VSSLKEIRFLQEKALKSDKGWITTALLWVFLFPAVFFFAAKHGAGALPLSLLMTVYGIGILLIGILMKYLPAEKVRPVSAAEKEDQDAKESARTADNDGYEPLREAGIEPGDGLFYCQGDEELYRTLLAEYIAEYPGKSDEIRRCFEAKDWKNYGIFVHSLKSSSRMLGAKDLSETAARLEAAANAKDEETILREHGRMMAGYEAVARAVRNTVQAPEPETEQDVFEFEPEETEQ